MFNALADVGFVVVEVGPLCTAVSVGDSWAGITLGEDGYYYYGDGTLRTWGGSGTNCFWIEADYGFEPWDYWQSRFRNGMFELVPVSVGGHDYSFWVKWEDDIPPPPPTSCGFVVVEVGPLCTAVSVGDSWAGITLGEDGYYYYGDGTLRTWGGSGTNCFWIEADYGFEPWDYWQSRFRQGMFELVPVSVGGHDYSFWVEWREDIPFPPSPPFSGVNGLIYTDWGNVQFYIYDASAIFPIPLYTFEGTNFSWAVTSGVYLVTARISMPDITDEIFSEPFTVGGVGWSTNIVFEYHVTNSVTLKFYGQYGTPLGGAMIEIFRRSCDYTYVPPPFYWFDMDPTAKPPPGWYPAYFEPNGWYFWDNVSTVNYLRTLPDGSVTVTLPDGVYFARVWDNRLKEEVVKEFRVGEGYYNGGGSSPQPAKLLYSVYVQFTEEFVIFPVGIVCKKYELKPSTVILDYNGLEVGQFFEVWGSTDLITWEYITDMIYFGPFEIPRRIGEDRYFWKVRTY